MIFRLKCFAVVASLLPLMAQAAPDLVPDVSQLTTNGTLKIVNQGTEPAGASVATIVCQKQGGGSCAEAPGMAAYENAAYPNAVAIPVPVVVPGSSHSHTLSFWDDLTWTPGTYAFTVVVDAGADVAEGNEGNNQVVTQKVVLPASVGTPPEGVGGFAARAGGRRKQAQAQPGASGTLVAGLPDITGTALGFAVNGFTAWGTATTIEEPFGQLKATKAGPGKNMCLIITGLYRTFNKSDYAAGSFIDIVYRNGTPVYTRHVPSLGPRNTINFQNHDLTFQEGMNVIQVKMDANSSISESDENNTFEVKVIVKVDCNGDGVIAGTTPPIGPPKIKSPTRRPGQQIAPLPQERPRRGR